MHVNVHRRIDDVGWCVTIEVSLFDATIFESNRSPGHQLGHAETDSGLKLAFHGQRIHCQPTINRHRRAMNLWTLVFNRNINSARYRSAEAFMARDARRMSLWQLASPRGALFIHQIERGAELLCLRLKKLTTVSNRIHFRSRG